jgi:hypothetical protein
MFIDRSDLIRHNPSQLYYGVAVTDLDNDGQFEIFATGFGYPNLQLKWERDHFVSMGHPVLADPGRQSIGVAAGDLDGDGQEELYVLNTDTFAGRKRFADRLFDYADGEWADLFSLNMHRDVLNLTAGRSVAVLDRFGSGRYGFFIANYGGAMRLYELDDDGHLYDAAPAAHLDRAAGGRSLLIGSLDGYRQSIFAGNENGSNFLFHNNGDGTFTEIAEDKRVHDPAESARGVAMLDTRHDGIFDIALGNWEGFHRLFVMNNDRSYEDRASAAFREPSRVRTVIAADFDNDGQQEVFFNNIGQANRLFAYRGNVWRPESVGDANEPFGLGTGAGIGDFDGDGRLELLIAHGESGAQPLSLYHTAPNDNHWFRVLPLTRFGAPARNALVIITTDSGRQYRNIDSGSGYLCQMEPVAHFGLGADDTVHQVQVIFPDGASVDLHECAADQVVRVPYPVRKEAKLS